MGNSDLLGAGGATAGDVGNQNVFCGVFLNPAGGQTTNAVVKTSAKPFNIRVKFDENESVSSTTSVSPPTTNGDETVATNAANKGFQIKYVQTSC